MMRTEIRGASAVKVPLNSRQPYDPRLTPTGLTRQAESTAMLRLPLDPRLFPLASRESR
jgi:hypothetical protein